MSPHGLLLDTHALLWWMGDDPQLGAAVRRHLAEGRLPVHVSAATVWEIGIKFRIGRLSGVEDFLADPSACFRRWSFLPLPMDHDDARLAAALVWDHRDPFDRMLVAQARRHHLALATCDPAIVAFAPGCVWD